MAAVRNNQLIFEWYEMFGNDKLYPQSRNAVEICKMLNYRNIKNEHISHLESLGFDVKIISKG